MAFPFFSLVFILVKLKKLGEHEFEGKYGELYAGLKLNDIKSLAYPFLFLLRRFLMMAITVFGNAIPNIQI